MILASTQGSQQNKPKRWPLRWRLSFWGSLFALIYFGGDSLLPLLEHGGHLLMESFEMLIEEFYEHVLHLPRRQAEIVTVWSGITIIFLLLRQIIKMLVRRTIDTYIAIHDWFFSTIAAFNDWRHALSEADITILAVAGVVVFFMLLSLL